VNRHTSIRLQLYDYATDHLSGPERTVVERHLAACPECKDALQQLTSTLTILSRGRTDPSEERPPEFWSQFAATVDLATRETTKRRFHPFSGLVERVRTAFFFEPEFAYGLAGAALLLVVGITYWYLKSPERQPGETFTAAQPVVNEQSDERMAQYFRKSKALLVGLANLKTTQGRPVDLTDEQALSRELISEARELRVRDLDPRSTRLINKLERILIEVANIENHQDIPNVEIIRSGIRQENLLFKIRMAEASYDTSHFINARYGY
jgi:hypothetical protein